MYRSVTWVIWLCECVFYQLPKIVSVEFLIFLYVLSAKFNKHDKKQIWITQCLQCYCLVCYRTNIKMNFYPNFFFLTKWVTKTHTMYRYMNMYFCLYLEWFPLLFILDCAIYNY